MGVEGIQAGGGVSCSTKLDWHKVQTDFSRIGPRKYLRFDVPFAPGRNVVYISIFGQDERRIANGLQRNSDLSIIVTKDGYIKDAEYGAIRKDTSGKYH